LTYLKAFKGWLGYPRLGPWVIPTQPHEPGPSRQTLAVYGKARSFLPTAKATFRLLADSMLAGPKLAGPKLSDLGDDLPGPVGLPAGRAVARLALIADKDLLLEFAAIASCPVTPLAGRDNAAAGGAVVPADAVTQRGADGAVLCREVVLALVVVQRLGNLQGKDGIDRPIVVVPPPV